MSEEKKKVQSAWLFGGYHRRRSMLSQIKKKFEGAELFVCDSSVSFEFFMSHIQSTGCFDDHKLVIINEMPFFKDSSRTKNIKALKESLSSLDESIFVVFNGISPTKEKALFSHVQSIGKIYEYFDLIDRKEAPRWVIDQFLKKGYSIEHSSAEVMVDTCGHDRNLNGVGADLLEMAIEKVVKYLGDDKKVTLEAIEANIFSHESFIIWDVLKAVDEKNYEKCVSLLSKVNLLDDNVIQAITQMMNTLLWRFRLLLMLKDSLAHLKEYQKVVDAALSIHKTKKIGDRTGISASYEVETYATGENIGKPQSVWTRGVIDGALSGFYGKEAAVNLYSRRDIYRIIRAIQNAVLHLRGCRSESLAYLLADTVFMVVCNAIDDQNLKVIISSFEKVIL